MKTVRRSRKKNQRDLFEPRIRFNWGFHDAAWEVLNHRERVPVLTGAHGTSTVSREYDPAYYEGWIRGHADAKAGRYVPGKTLSTEAWEEYQATCVACGAERVIAGRKTPKGWMCVTCATEAGYPA